MNVQIGSTRAVLVFSHIVIKFPKSNSKFFKNLIINWLEFFCYAIYHPAFCMPTYFYFFGFVNIQKRGIQARYQDEKAKKLVVSFLDTSLKKYIVENNISRKEQTILGHDVSSVNNLYWDNKFLRCIDYGSLPMYKFAKKTRKNLILESPD